jgi:hypothetical protein
LCIRDWGMANFGDLRQDEVQGAVNFRTGPPR